MRLVEFATPRGPRAGLLRDGRVFDVGDAPEGGLQGLLGRLGSVEPEGDGVALENAELLPPIARPAKIICIGLNYRAHAEEGGREVPETPAVFAKFATSLRGSARRWSSRAGAPRSTTGPRWRS